LTARISSLAHRGLRLGGKRVLRLMRLHHLLAPRRLGPPNGDPAHAGTITTPRPDEMWGTDATRFYTEEDGWCWFFGAIDHCVDELVGWHTAKIGDRWTALVELTRFRGHPMVWGERTVHDAEEPSAVPPGVPAADHRPGAEGANAEELARQFEPSAQAIRNWVRQADRDGGRRQDGLTTLEQDELRRLRRENRALREEREILRNQSGTVEAVPPVGRETRDAAMLIGAPGTVAVSFMLRSRAR
jgi:transposase-like protein